MDTTTRTPRNWPYIIACVFVWSLLLGTLFMSSMDTIITAHKLGLHGVKAWTAPGLVDAFAIVGKLGRLDRFTEDTRKTAFKIMMVGGLLSLFCNFYAGDTDGERGYGVVLVGAFLLLEHFAGKLNTKPAEDETADTTPAVDMTAVRAAAKKNADRARKLAAATPTMRPSELARACGINAGTAGRILKAVRATAPVSPGHGPIPLAATVAQLEAIAA